MRAWLESVFTNCSIFRLSGNLSWSEEKVWELLFFLFIIIFCPFCSSGIVSKRAGMENLWLSIYLPYTAEKRKKKWTHFDIYCKLQLVDMTLWSIIYLSYGKVEFSMTKALIGFHIFFSIIINTRLIQFRHFTSACLPIQAQKFIFITKIWS